MFTWFLCGHAPVQAGKLVVDPVKLQPVSRLGGVVYGCVSELFEIGRPNANGTYSCMKTKAEAAAEAVAARTRE